MTLAIWLCCRGDILLLVKSIHIALLSVNMLTGMGSRLKQIKKNDSLEGSITFQFLIFTINCSHWKSFC